MLSAWKFYKDFLLLDSDSRRALSYASEVERDWDYGTTSIFEIGDKLAIFFWFDEKKSEERIRKAIKLANKYDISVRRVTFK